MATKTKRPTKGSPKKKPATGRKPTQRAKRPGPRGPQPASQAKGRSVAARRPVRKAALAGPTPSAAPAKPAPARPDPARPTALAIAQAGLDKKAEDVTLLDVRGLTSYADYFVVMTADSDRQASAIADNIDETLKKMGVSKVGVEGYQGGRWILVDFGDVVAHVFNRESRGFYDLEGLWADAPRMSITG
ncbi:MAG TPA: ribosome silencing factor [Anaeromyxobacteraceae bacterium]|nr:ribosome silencing factor [Anaeromyxobacteraceae bacterium]